MFDGNGAPIVRRPVRDLAGGRRRPASRRATTAPGLRLRPRLDGRRRQLRDRDGRAGSFKGPSGETYAPQISVAIFARGLLKAVQTRVFLASLDAIKDDPLARAIGDPDRLRTLIATRDPNDPKIYRWDVRLRGAGETVFIDI